MIRLIPAAACRTMPWKNGGGSTTEIALAPAGAGIESFDWRVSMADIVCDGPFSSFPGIDRSLAIIAGDGIRLAIDGRPPVDLTDTSPPLSFPGDVAADAALLAGPVTDLNVMSRRGVVSHRLSRVSASGEIAATAPIMLLICQRGQISVATAGGGFELGPRDTLLGEQVPTGPWLVRAGERGGCLLVELFPVG